MAASGSPKITVKTKPTKPVVAERKKRAVDAGKVVAPTVSGGLVVASHVPKSDFTKEEEAARKADDKAAPAAANAARSKIAGGGEDMFNELDELQTELFRTEFSLFDNDNSGFITVEEFGTVMRSLGVDMPEGELLDMVKAVDHDRDGAISYDEFVMMMRIKMTNQCNEDELAEAFRTFDEDESGFVTADELLKAMSCLGEATFSEDECIELMQIVDTDGDGRIDYSEFAQLLSGTGAIKSQEKLG